MFERYRIIHFVGIGGIGMSGIAELLRNLGYEVTGSDLNESQTTKRLQTLGIKIYIGHDKKNVDDAHVLVISSAVKDDNPEVVEARKKSIPVIPRAEMLAELARLKYSVLVAGAHGKTTTTSLISTLLTEGNFDPTVVIGGRLKATGKNAVLGKGEFLVAEADESDGSFLKLSPTIGVVTNIDREHMDFFKNMDSLKKAFLEFINKVPFYGASIVCIENQHIKEILPLIHRKYMTYGFSEEAELRAVNIKKGFMSVNFDVLHKNKYLGEFKMRLPGVHNVLNGLAAIGCGITLQMDVDIIRNALENFSGIQRRLEFKGEQNGIMIYDDYGHHPAEIKATLRAIKEGIFENLPSNKKSGSLFVLFQPHRYSRTKDLLDEFSESFDDADMLFVLDIYPAGEKPVEGINSQRLVEKIKNKGKNKVLYLQNRQKAAEQISLELKEGDVLLTLGAGDVWKIGEEILYILNKKDFR